MQRTTTIANFNCTYGKTNDPMLTYFSEIIYPYFNVSILAQCLQ